MPRGARLDVLGVVQHVMARGIERRDIFGDAGDREAFLDRLAAVVVAGEAQLLAWSLLPNHFHLVLRPRKLYLKDLMRRLMTGYAGGYNRRHGRDGHLFQSRYRSLVVGEEPYLLELVRYVHLNPLRAGLVSDLTALDGYRYSGHAVLMGNRAYEVQAVDEVLGRFGSSAGRARLAYRDFVAAGVCEGESPPVSRRRPGAQRRRVACPQRAKARGAGARRSAGAGRRSVCNLVARKRRTTPGRSAHHERRRAGRGGGPAQRAGGRV